MPPPTGIGCLPDLRQRTRVGGLRLVAVDEAVLDREQRRSRSGRDPELRVDVLDVARHRLGRHGEGDGDRLVGPAPGQQAEDLHLAGGEPRGPRSARPHPLPGRSEDSCDRVLSSRPLLTSP